MFSFNTYKVVSDNPTGIVVQMIFHTYSWLSKLHIKMFYAKLSACLENRKKHLKYFSRIFLSGGLSKYLYFKEPNFKITLKLLVNGFLSALFKSRNNWIDFTRVPAQERVLLLLLLLLLLFCLLHIPVTQKNRRTIYQV